MADKGVLFNGDMVKATMDGRKRVTRRPVKHQPEHGISGCHYSGAGFAETDKMGRCRCRPVNPPYRPGDILYVQETWRCVKYDSMDGNLGYGVEFRLDGERRYFEFDDNERFHQFGKFATKNGWQSSMFLPREAARMFLRVTAVRAEKLQEMKYSDFLNEGMPYKQYEKTIRDKFKYIWDGIYASRGYGWDAKPWVWVIEFERTEVAD